MRHSRTNKMENPVDKSLGEVTVPYVFTFVPVVHKLPIKSCLEETSAASGGKQHENVAEETTRENVSEEQPFRSMYIPNSEHREEKCSTQSHKNTETARAPPQDLVSGSAPSFSDQSQNTSSGGQATMEAAANRHTDISQQPYQCVPGRASEPHKIKSSYKSLAAIPTNTLLLDQQVIDEQVERGEASSGDRGVPLDAQETDTHEEMCSPAWLKKESEELYAVIDEILRSSPIPSKSKSPVVKESQKNNSTFPRTYGRETKYASVGSLKPNANDQRRADLHKTRPGVIRTMATSPRLTPEDPHRQSECSPSRHFVSQLHFSTKGRNTSGVDSGSEGKTLGGEVRPLAPSACDLHITEPEELLRLPPKHGPSTSFCPTERKPEAFQTQI
ncbi:hypothetical protein NL108_016489 [Boleophthalmus pectinirostris]|nr:hypothetical protein NL108_016489 [Boleophthalmus pectinirostris]